MPVGQKRAHKYSTRNVRCLIACAKEQSDKRIHHLLAEIFGESEEGEHLVDGHYGKGHFEFLDDLKDAAELFDVGGEVGGQLGGEDIGPEVFSLSETYSERPSMKQNHKDERVTYCMPTAVGAKPSSRNMRMVFANAGEQPGGRASRQR